MGARSKHRSKVIQRSKVVRADGVKLKLDEAFKLSVLSKYLLLV